MENIWPNKIEYSISIPSKAVIFGSYIQVDFRLIPLLKGLVIGQVTTQVREEQEFCLDPEWGISALNGGLTKQERVIASDTYTIDPEKDEQILDEAAEGFQFSRYLELPKSLNGCIQDCNVKGIKVRHKVKFNIQLRNPDRHISELRANLPVSMYISPALPINANNDLVDQTPQASRAAVAHDLENSAPPLYGEHQLDQLYMDVDPSGYLTPGAALSGDATPFASSRNISSENLVSLNAITAGGHVSAEALQHRLQNLRVSNGRSHLVREDPDIQVQPASGVGSRRNSAHTLPAGYFSHESSGNNTHARVSPHEGAHTGANGTSCHAGSVSISRRVSEEEDGYVSGSRTPFPQYAHMEDLAKVPSYSTAVRTPISTLTPYGPSTELPTYGAAVAEPLPPVLMEPPSAHIRGSTRDTSLASSPEERMMMAMNAGRAVHRHVGTLQDEDRRLRMMQQRGRG